MTPSALGSTAVLLIHGLGGVACGVDVPQKALYDVGAVAHVPTLPGHGTYPENPTHMPAKAWSEALTQMYERLAAEHNIVHIMGMCMGALLVLVLAHRVRHGIARPQNRLALLATSVHIDGWSTPQYRDLCYAVYCIPGMAARMRVEKDEPFDIKNPLLRRIIKVKLARGDSFHYPWVPLACIRQVDRLRRWALAGVPDMQCQTLVTHSHEDEFANPRSAQMLQVTLPHARNVVLENSYHMICADNDRGQVVAEVLGFSGFDPAAARRKGSVAAD